MTMLLSVSPGLINDVLQRSGLLANASDHRHEV
jgi:hypothetical protein